MFYHPEMGEKAEVRLFHTEHNFRDDYTVAWRVEDDECARAVLRKLRIRIRRPAEVGKLGTNLLAKYMGGDVFYTGITSGANRKLTATDVAAMRLLLD